MKEISFIQEALALTSHLPGARDFGSVPNIPRRDFDETETFTFRTQVPCMEYLSLLIENAVLLRTNRGGRVYAGFEKLSRMEAIVDRYLRIADVSERLYVFGTADWHPPRHPHMKIIAIPPDAPLAREWFVIANSSSYRVALLGRDEDGFAVPVLEDRYFSAVKTSHPEAVVKLAEAAENLIDGSLGS